MRLSGFFLAIIPALALALAGGASTAAERSDILLVDRATSSEMLDAPPRGWSMTQVEARFGAPIEKLAPRGGQQPGWPPIHRWIYADYTVYFENTRVINVVARQASAEEIGPVPVP